MAIEGLLRQFLLGHDISPGGILVAVSGGSDSTALLLALHELRDEGYSVSAAHVNHGLRGQESDDDQRFVEALCLAHGIRLQTARGELPADDVRRSGIEAAARRIRYELFETMRVTAGASHIATGHTRRDHAETVLMRFLTGSGTARLQGIKPVTSRNVIRPLLEADREEILAFLAEREIEARHDSSNDDERFLRSRIRRDIMPRLLELNPNLVATLAETANQARSQQSVLDRVIRQSIATWVKEESRSAIFTLENAPEDDWLVQACLAREIRRLEPELRDVSAQDLTRLAGELPTLRRASVSRRLELIRKGGDVILRERPSAPEPFELDIVPDEPLDIPQIGKRITLARRGKSLEESTSAFQLPPGGPSTFQVRNRRAGDRFHPTGRSAERSLGDFLIERRIPREVRDSIPLLTWKGQIVSVTGVEISDVFRVRDSGEETYVIILEDIR